MPLEASRWTLRGTWRLIVKELSAFGVVGGVSRVLDTLAAEVVADAEVAGAAPGKRVRPLLREPIVREQPGLGQPVERRLPLVRRDPRPV